MDLSVQTATESLFYMLNLFPQGHFAKQTHTDTHQRDTMSYAGKIIQHKLAPSLQGHFEARAHTRVDALLNALNPSLSTLSCFVYKMSSSAWNYLPDFTKVVRGTQSQRWGKQKASHAA